MCAVHWHWWYTDNASCCVYRMCNPALTCSQEGECCSLLIQHWCSVKPTLQSWLNVNWLSVISLTRLEPVGEVLKVLVFIQFLMSIPGLCAPEGHAVRTHVCSRKLLNFNLHNNPFTEHKPTSHTVSPLAVTPYELFNQSHGWTVWTVSPTGTCCVSTLSVSRYTWLTCVQL